MVDILHRVGIVAPQDKVHAALTTVEGLAGWWTSDTVGDSVLEFRFGELGGFDMSLKALVETGTGAPHSHDVQISNWH